MECEIKTIAGSTEGYQDGVGINSKFSRPFGVAIDKDRNIYVVDTFNHRIRKISSNGIVTTVAGSGSPGYQDGDGINSKFYSPTGVAIDEDGNIIVVDNDNNRIRKISSNGIVTTVAGNTQGYQDGPGSNSKFCHPFGVAIDKDGNIFISDGSYHRIRKISSIGVVTTVAGNGGPGYQDGDGINSKFNAPSGIAIDKDGNIFVADCGNNRIRKVSVNGVVSTVAGDGTQGYQDGDRINSKFNRPFGVAIDNDGNIFIADTDNNRIRKLSSIGQVSTVAGDGYKNGNGTNSKFSNPIGLAIDKHGCNIFVADTYNQKIIQINLKEWEKIIPFWPSTHSLLKDKNDHIFALLLVLKNYTNLPDELNLEIVKSFLWVELFIK